MFERLLDGQPEHEPSTEVSEQLKRRFRRMASPVMNSLGLFFYPFSPVHDGVIPVADELESADKLWSATIGAAWQAERARYGDPAVSVLSMDDLRDGPGSLLAVAEEHRMRLEGRNELIVLPISAFDGVDDDRMPVNWQPLTEHRHAGAGRCPVMLVAPEVRRMSLELRRNTDGWYRITSGGMGVTRPEGIEPERVSYSLWEDVHQTQFWTSYKADHGIQ